MASNVGPLALAERADIHKSCKSLETLLNALNDYCEAASAAGTLQKKLAKALREAAGLKATGDIATNAMNTSATIFEALSDIDSKFMKIVDREYDGISAEVKKWFKRLAKEEKAHDERMSNANAKIKQAGQVYEKKSRKNARDATEEHARYINLISTLGPEISQEKYDHAMNVTQRHTSTTYSVAACLSRIADAEWLRVCEGVRRFSPTVGQLGEWRALCEGGWTGPIPQDLLDLEESQHPQPDHEIESFGKQQEDEEREAPTTLRNIDSRESTEQSRSPPGYTSAESEHQRDHILARDSPTLIRPNQSYPPASSGGQERSMSTGPSSFEPPRPFVDAHSGSVRSLSAFPSPPTHFPIPPPRHQQLPQSSPLPVNFPAMSRLTESPLPQGDDEGTDDHSTHPPPSPRLHPANPSSPISVPASPERHFQERSADASGPEYESGQQFPAASSPSVSGRGRNIETSSQPESSSHPGTAHSKSDYLDSDREFGMNIGHNFQARTSNASKSQPVERSDTGGSSGSIVAAMRNRYSNNSGVASHVLKDVPRSPHSVSDLASRYQPAEGPPPPRHMSTSLSTSRQLPLQPINTGTQVRQSDSHQDRIPSGGNKSGPSPSTAGATPIPDDEAARRRRQRISDLAELELREKELELRQRERDIDMRARELERDRARLQNVREGDEYAGMSDVPRSAAIPQPQIQLRPRERRTSFRQQRPQSTIDPGRAPAPSSSNNAGRPHSQYSYSATNLVPPSPSTNSAQASHSHDGQSPRHSQYPQSASSPSHQSTQHQDDGAPHAPYCGCETCSVTKYKSPSSPPRPADLRPPAKPITLRPVEKSKPGWMRRLSMPVGNAFHLDSKKGNGNVGILGGQQQGRGGMFSLDGKKNVSTTNLMSSGAAGRRSYDASGISNRSMTNLGYMDGRR